MMKKRILWSLLIVLLVFTNIPVISQEVPQPIYSERSEKIPEKPDYLAYIKEMYDELSVEVTQTVLYGRIADARRITNFAATSAKLYEYTGEEKYLKNAKSAFDVFVSECKRTSQTVKSNEFFTYEPLACAYNILKKYYDIDEGAQLILRMGFRKNAEAWVVNDDNQALSRACGTIGGYTCFPDDPFAKEWLTYVDEVWHCWADKKESDENAGNYNAIAVEKMIVLARALNREDIFFDPVVKEHIFERLKAQVAPFGIMPEYGDDYLGEWMNTVVVFEYAGKIYDDPEYLYIARRMFEIGNLQFPKVKSNEEALEKRGDSDLWSMQELFELSCVLDFGVSEKEAKIPEVKSTVTTRYDAAHDTVYNKLMLGSDARQGSPFVFMDIYGNGAHGHYNRPGSIGYYEAGGIPQFYGTARHNRASIYSDVLAVVGEEYEFPMYDVTKQEAETWMTGSVPLNFLTNIEGQDKNKRFISQVLFRLDASSIKENYGLVVDNIRLEGAAGTLILDDMESKWTRTDDPYSLVSNCTQGNYALHITIKPKADYFYRSPYYGKWVDLTEYDTIKFDWYFESPTGTMDFASVFRLFDTGRGNSVNDTKLGDINVRGNVDKCIAYDIEKDSVGEVHMSNYCTYDTSAVRKIVLLDEGILVVQDSIETIKAGAGFNAGPIWHQLTEPTESGKNWFNSKSDPNKDWYSWTDKKVIPKNDLLVWFEENEGMEYGNTEGIQIINNPTKTQVSYAKKTLEENSKITFVSVLYPHREKSAQLVANAISAKTLSYKNSVVNVKCGESDIKITFTEDEVKIERK